MGTDKPGFPCACGGTFEYLQVSPKRSTCYLNTILMCNRCKRILA